MEYLLLGGIVLGGILSVVGVMYGVFKWSLINKVMIIVMPMILIMVMLGYWIGTSGVTAATAAIGCTLGVSSVVTVFLITNRMLFKPFAMRALYMEEESEYLVRQVAEISAVMRDVANEGDLSRVLQAEREDDVGKLVNSVNTMVESLREHAVISETIAGGDLTVRVRPKSERDVLGNAFARMVDGLNNVIGRLAHNAEELDIASRRLAEAAKQAGNATGQVAGASQEIAKGASDQARHAQDTARSVEQLSGIIAGIAKGAEAQASGVTKASSSVGEVSEAIDRLSSNANFAAEGSLKAAEVAGDGVSVTKETVDGMKEIMGTVEVVSGKVMELGQRSTEIG
ncbi:MAG: methyl-accepting chemotaxis protein, partial [Chloroflexota bacterium]|nr:methyl-accepting chemotaxis protein [Chloroflexota bacterium]